MAFGHPSDASPEGWYEAAKNVDQNHAANEAFKLAYQTPRPAPVRTTPTPVRAIAQNILHLHQLPIPIQLWETPYQWISMGIAEGIQPLFSVTDVTNLGIKFRTAL